MNDIQNQRDHRRIPIEQVGVTDLQYPITVIDRGDERLRTVASITMSVNLPHDCKGIHMSRFIEVLDQHQDEFSMPALPSILQEIKRRLEAESARIEIVFPYFLERFAPVSGRKALMDYECTLTGEVNGGHDDFLLGVKVPVTSLCPCSKTISDYGAHSQRGYITIQIRSVREDDGSPAPIWIEEIIDIAEKSASAPVYPLLKRDDERHVTMQAYDHPVFVEDMVREAATRLQADARVAWFRVHAINHESIHRHNAFAQVSWPGVSLDEVLFGSIHDQVRGSAGHDAAIQTVGCACIVNH